MIFSLVIKEIQIKITMCHFAYQIVHTWKRGSNIQAWVKGKGYLHTVLEMVNWH